VKRITVSVTDETHRRARMKAAECDSSVSALVRDYLAGLGADESDVDRGRRLQSEVLATIQRFRGGNRLTRDMVHRRRSARDTRR
jgi:hypothetical protein